MAWILFFSIIGIILICLEVFLPGMVVGAVGAVCLVLAVVLTYVLEGTASGHIALMTLIISSAMALVLWIFVFPKTRSGRLMITSRNLADSKTAESLNFLMGKAGMAITPLRPAGTALFDHRRVDVVAESGLIEPESSIKVVLVEGNRVVVRKL